MPKATPEEPVGSLPAGVLWVLELVEGNTEASIGAGSRRACDRAGDSVDHAGS